MTRPHIFRVLVACCALAPPAVAGAPTPLLNGDFERGFTDGVPQGWTHLGGGQLLPGSQRYLCVGDDAGGIPASPEYLIVHHAYEPFDGTLVQTARTVPGARYRLAAYVNCRHAAQQEQLCAETPPPGTDPYTSWAFLGYDPTGQAEEFQAPTVQYVYAHDQAGYALSRWFLLATTFVAEGEQTSIYLRNGMKWPAVMMHCWNDVVLELLSPPEETVESAAACGTLAPRTPDLAPGEIFTLGEGLALPLAELEPILAHERIDLPTDTAGSLVLCNPFGPLDLVADVPLRARAGQWCRVAGRVRTAPLFRRGVPRLPMGEDDLAFRIASAAGEAADADWQPLPPGESGWAPFAHDFVADATALTLQLRARWGTASRRGVLLRDLSCGPLLAQPPVAAKHVTIRTELAEREALDKPPAGDGASVTLGWLNLGRGEARKTQPADVLCTTVDWERAMVAGIGEVFIERTLAYGRMEGALVTSFVTHPGATYRVVLPYLLLRTATPDAQETLCETREVDPAFLVAFGVDRTGQTGDFAAGTIDYEILSAGKQTTVVHRQTTTFTAASARTSLYLRTRQEDSGIGVLRLGNVVIEQTEPGPAAGLVRESVPAELIRRLEAAPAAGTLPPRWRHLLGRDDAGDEVDEATGSGELGPFALEAGNYDLIVPHLPRTAARREAFPAGVAFEGIPSATVAMDLGAVDGTPVLRLLGADVPCAGRLSLAQVPQGGAGLRLRVRCSDRFSPTAARLRLHASGIEKEYRLSPDGVWRELRFDFVREATGDPVLSFALDSPAGQLCLLELALPIACELTREGRTETLRLAEPAGEPACVPLAWPAGVEAVAEPFYSCRLLATVQRVRAAAATSLTVRVPSGVTGVLALPVPDGGDPSVPGGDAAFAEAFALSAEDFAPEGGPTESAASGELPDPQAAYHAAGPLARHLLGAYLHGPSWAGHTLDALFELRQTPAAIVSGLVPLVGVRDAAPYIVRGLERFQSAYPDGGRARRLAEWHVRRMIDSGLDLHGSECDRIVAGYPPGAFVRDSLLLARAEDLIDRQREEDALALLEGVVHPSLAARREAARGLAYLGLEDMESAAKVLDGTDLDTLDPERAAKVLMGQAMIRVAEGDFAGAQDALQRFLLRAQDPTAIEAARNLLDWLKEAGAGF